MKRLKFMTLRKVHSAVLVKHFLRSLFLGVIIGTHQSAFAGKNFDKVLMIVFENTHKKVTDSQVDFAEYAKRGASLEKMKGETHPSQPNYIAMIAGSTLGVSNNKNNDLNHQHLGDLLEAKGLSWKSYAEDYPGDCFQGSQSGRYVRKHNPFISFTNVTSKPQRCAKIVSLPELYKDIANNELPNFAFVEPNLMNDGHDTDVEFAGKWLRKTFGKYLENPSLLGNTLIVLTFDEDGEPHTDNAIYTVLIGKNVKAGTKNFQSADHTTLLKLIEDEFGLGSLGRQDASAEALQGIWK